MPVVHSDRPQIFDFELPDSIQQAAPVQNTWYTVMDIGVPLRCDTIQCSISTTGETLELELTISGGAAIVITIVAVAGAINCVFRESNPIITTPFLVEDYNPEHRATPIFECHSLLVRIRKTTAAGAGNLNASVQWGRLERA